MNRQIVVCVLTLLTSSISASDRVAGWISNLDMKSKLEGLQSNFAFVRTGCADTYGLFRSTCVNSTLLAKCPETLQGIVQNNFGLLATITGGALASGLAWQLHKWRYASKYRNGTEEYQVQELEKMVPELGNKLVMLSNDSNLLQEGNLKTISLKPSLFGPEALKVVVSNVRGNMWMSVTNCLMPNSVVSTFKRSDKQSISAALFSLGGYLRTNQTLIQKTARALARTSEVSYIIGSGSFEIAPDCWRQAVYNVLLYGQLPILTNPTMDANDIAKIQTGMALPSASPLIGLSLQGDDINKRITMSLLNQTSGEQINFALHSAGRVLAFERLKSFWITNHLLANCIRSVMVEYALYTPSVGQKERNVRFTAPDRVKTSQQKPNNNPSITSEELRHIEWVLVANDGAHKGTLVWPCPSNELLSTYALGNVLGIFLRSKSISKNFSGRRNYVVDIGDRPARMMGLNITKQANNISGLALAGDTDDRVITIEANDVKTKYTLTAQEGLFAADQLEDETLRAQIIDAIAYAHEWYRNDTSEDVIDEFELRLREENGKMYYQTLNEQGVLCWQSPSFSIASLSNTGQSSRPSSSDAHNTGDDAEKYDRQTISEELDKMDEGQSSQSSSSEEYTGAGKRIGLDFYYSSAQRFDADQTRQPNSSNNGASSSTDIQQPKRLSKRAMLEWLNAQTQFGRSTSPVARNTMQGHKRSSSLDNISAVEDISPVFALGLLYKDAEVSDDGATSSNQTAEDNSDGLFDLFGDDNVDDDGDDNN